MKALIGVLLFFSTIHGAEAQRICGTAEYKKQLIAANPSLQKQYAKVDQQINAVLNKKNQHIANRDTAVNEIIYIPVVIHLLYKNAVENISDDQVKSQLDALNKDFRNLNADRINTPAAFSPFVADTRIQFCLAKVDPQGKPTTGIERKNTGVSSFSADDAMKSAARGGVNSWDSRRYLNIWVCRLSGSSLGYATPPGGAADNDGVVIAYDVFGTTGNLRAPFNKGRTATHEIGHWLGLLHTWGDALCGDDQVNDTPTQKSYNYGCPSFPKMSTCSPNNNGDMFMNFMDFSDDACMNMFTAGQAKRMRSLFAEGNIRNEFLASFACDSLNAQPGPLPAGSNDTQVVSTVVPATIKVYPSPVHSLMTVEYKTASKTENIAIYNIVGMKVFSAVQNQEKAGYDLSRLAPGIYIVKIDDGKNKFITKIIKQ